MISTIATARDCAAGCTRWPKRSSRPACRIIERRLRNTTDVLRRALDNTLANWPLIALRIAENFLLVLLLIGSIVAAVVPLGIAAVFSNFDLKNPEEPPQPISALTPAHCAL